MYKTSELQLKDYDRWQTYLDKIEKRKKDIYFSPDYYRIFEDLGDGKAICFVVENKGDIALYPFLLNSIKNIGLDLDEEFFDIQGAYGYNGVISTSYDVQFIAVFNKAFSDYCIDRKIIAEFSRFHPLLGNYRFSEKRMKVIDDRETVMLDLRPDYEEIWQKQYTSKNRNMIRKAAKIGFLVDIVLQPTKDQMDEFIRIYHDTMRRVGANDYFYFNEQFFINTFHFLREHLYLFNIKNSDGRTISSAIFLRHGDFFHYHFAGRSEKAGNSVNNFLIDEVVKFAKEQGIKILHLGGGRTNSAKDSLLKFKKSFSRNSSSFLIGKKVHNQKIYDSLVSQWNDENPDLSDEYKNFLLKYRIKK